MSDISIFKQGGALTTRVRRESELSRLFANSSDGLRRIQLSSKGTFRRVYKGEQIGKVAHGSIDVIIVKALQPISREYYVSSYDSDAKATVPDCWSNLGDKPDPSAPNPQAKSCIDCPMNVEGSGQNGKKACRFQRRLGVLIYGDPSNELYQIKIPSRSIFGKNPGNAQPFEQYVKYLVANGASPDSVVTKIEYDETVDVVKVLFSPVRLLDDDEFDNVLELQADPTNSRYCTFTTAQADGAKPAMITAKPASTSWVDDDADEEEAPKKRKEEVFAPQAVVTKKPVVVDEDEEEEEPKPVKRVAKKAEPAPAPKKNLSDVIDAWGDEDD